MTENKSCALNCMVKNTNVVGCIQYLYNQTFAPSRNKICPVIVKEDTLLFHMRYLSSLIESEKNEKTKQEFQKLHHLLHLSQFDYPVKKELKSIIANKVCILKRFTPATNRRILDIIIKNTELFNDLIEMIIARNNSERPHAIKISEEGLSEIASFIKRDRRYLQPIKRNYNTIGKQRTKQLIPLYYCIRFILCMRNKLFKKDMLGNCECTDEERKILQDLYDKLINKQ